MATTASTDLDVFQQMRDFNTSKPVILKAHRYLTDGKVKVVSVKPTSVLVTGSEEYTVNLHNGTWLCDCPSRQPICAHVVAASLVCDLDSFEVPTSKEKITPFRSGAFTGSFARIAS